MENPSNQFELNGREQKRERREILGEMLKEISDRLNKQFRNESGESAGADILDGECRIDIRAFAEREKGPYTEEEISGDQEEVRRKEEGEFLPDLDNPNVAAYCRDKGAVTREEMIEVFRRERRQANPEAQEMAVTAALYKFLPDDYVAVRTSKYDDYVNGIDTLIVNRKTGEAVCTIDEFSAPEKSERGEKKMKKILSKARQGGARAKYGLGYTEGRLTKKPVGRIPAFNLRLSSRDLHELMAEMGGDIDAAPTEKEKAIISALIRDFREQIRVLLDSGLRPDMERKINHFKEWLGEWEESDRRGL